jgi:DNA-binding transcriptional regulator YhcF (GntR family)
VTFPGRRAAGRPAPDVPCPHTGVKARNRAGSPIISSRSWTALSVLPERTERSHNRCSRLKVGTQSSVGTTPVTAAIPGGPTTISLVYQTTGRPCQAPEPGAPDSCAAPPPRGILAISEAGAPKTLAKTRRQRKPRRIRKATEKLTQKLDGIYLDIRRRILTRSLYPGQKLSENTLARKHGVSRTPIREVLKRLERDGLVRIKPKSGTYVQQWSTRKIIELYQVRTYLECLAYRLALERASNADVTRLARSPSGPGPSRAPTTGSISSS